MEYFTVWIQHILFILSSVNGHLGCWQFFVLAVMNNTAMNIYVQVFMWRYVFISLGYIPRRRILVHRVTLCLTICGTARIIRRSCTIFHSYWQYMNVPVSPGPCQHVLLVFLIIVILVVMKRYAIMVVIYISPMTNYVEQLFMCLLAICISPLEKCLFVYFGHFKIGLFVFLLLNYKSSLYILDAGPLNKCFENIFSFCGLSFHYLGGGL